jgi:hypothetical protein
MSGGTNPGRSHAGFQAMSVGANDDAAAGMRILVDADACPVKQEIYRVAERHGLRVQVAPTARSRCRAIR